MGWIKDKLRSFLEGKAPEYEQFLGGFNHLFSKQIEYIIDVINEELKKSRIFGLVLKPEDEFKEKIVVLTIFNKWGHTLNLQGQKISNQEYEDVIRILINIANELLKSELEYYFSSTSSREVKTRYNCHLESLVSRLAKDFMERRCIFWM